MKKYEYGCVVERLEIDYFENSDDIYESKWSAYLQNTPDYLDEACDKAGYVKNKENWELSNVPFDVLGNLGFELKTSSVITMKKGTTVITETTHIFQKEKE